MPEEQDDDDKIGGHGGPAIGTPSIVFIGKNMAFRKLKANETRFYSSKPFLITNTPIWHLEGEVLK
jgi:hypothetical protein